MSSPVAGYSRLQIALHWLVVVAVAAQYLFNDAIGAAWRAFTTGTTLAFDPLVATHVFTGIAIGVLVLWRLVLRLRRGVPPPPEQEHPALKAIAHATHWAFYLVLVLLVASGGLAWFGGIGAEAIAHNVLKVALIALIVLHVAGALFQWIVLKSDVLTRMFRAAA